MLWRYRVLRGEHLRQLVFRGNSEATAARRGSTLLAELARQGFVVQVWMPKGSAAYVLGDIGRAWIRYSEGLKFEPRDQVATLGTKGSKVLHDVLIADFVTPIMLDTEAMGGRLDWRCGRDNLDRDGYKFVQWDAHLDLHIAGTRISFFVEIDRGTEDLAKFGEKVARYAGYQGRGDWKAAMRLAHFPIILVVTSGAEERIMNMADEVAAMSKTYDPHRVLDWRYTTFRRLELAATENPLDAVAWGDISGGNRYQSMLVYDFLLNAALDEWKRIARERDAATSQVERGVLTDEWKRWEHIYRAVEAKRKRM